VIIRRFKPDTFVLQAVQSPCDGLQGYGLTHFKAPSEVATGRARDIVAGPPRRTLGTHGSDYNAECRQRSRSLLCLPSRRCCASRSRYDSVLERALRRYDAAVAAKDGIEHGGGTVEATR